MIQIPLYLAPMAGFTDAPFRVLCRKLGANRTVTEMISARALVYRDKKTGQLAKIPAQDTSCAIQLFGHEPDILEEATGLLLSGEFPGGKTFHCPPTAIDLNMGCPVRKIVTSGDGSALMRDPRLCGELVKHVCRAAAPYKAPVTVKIRAGWSKDEINAPLVAQICAENGASAVTVHGRTKDQMYAPYSDNIIIRQVRKALPPEVAVIGSGDVTDGESAAAMLRETECDGIMIGREALGNPWIFDAVHHALAGKPWTPPTENVRIRTALELIEAIVAEKGEERGIREARGRAAHFIKGLPGAPRLRDQLNRSSTLEDVQRLLTEVIGD